MSWAWDQPLRGTQKLVLLKLADCAHQDGTGAFRGQKRMAEECGISRRGFQYAVYALRDAGYIEIVHRQRPDGGDTTNEYVLHTAHPPAQELRTPVRNSEAPVTVPKEPEGESKDSPSLPKTAKKRKPDPIFDELQQLFGKAPAGKLARGAWNAATASLRADEASPQEIRHAADLWRRTYPEIRLTPTALAKHFAGLVPRRAPPPNGDLTTEERDALREAWIAEQEAKLNGSNPAREPHHEQNGHRQVPLLPGHGSGNGRVEASSPDVPERQGDPAG